MAAGPLAVEGSPAPPSWRLDPASAMQTQGLIVSPFGHQKVGVALLLGLPDEAGGAWLAALRRAVTITDATGPASPCAAIAFTGTGLAAMGLDRQSLESFSVPFTEGMLQQDRRLRLGDEGPQLIPGGPLWSSGAAPGATPATVHAALLLYADDDAGVAAVRGVALDALAACGVAVVREIPMRLRYGADESVAREHFGFVDGISQPVPYGPNIQTADGSPMPQDPWHGVPSGDILFGYLDSFGQESPGPFVKVGVGEACALPQNAAPHGFRDLGRNGSYLVIRELRQDVARFWTSMDAAAEVLADHAIDAVALAQRIVGRTLDGDPLSPGGPLPPQGGAPANSFGYKARDPYGFGCPMGSHMRRANPRDGLAPKPRLAQALLKTSNNHRILRRARSFGPDIADPRVDDGQERGLLFMAVNSDIERQFELVQQNWLLNPTLAVLYDETDPLLGPGGPFTIPSAPVRRRASVENYVQLAGGDYFFLPSLPALDYLGSLK